MPADKYAELGLKRGAQVGKSWVIDDKLGEGGCCIVFGVRSVNPDGNMSLEGKRVTQAAAKVQLVSQAKRGPLTMEIAVIKAIHGHRNVPDLIEAGRVGDYQYLILSLLGPNLAQLRVTCRNGHFTRATTVRLAMQMLSSVEHMHNKLYIHRDIKPSNFAIGSGGEAQRICFILDFGLARQYATLDAKGDKQLKRARSCTPFRGTVRYCSSFVLAGHDSCRRDDLISLVYTWIELYGGRLPWTGIRDREEVQRQKQYDSGAELFEKVPPQIRAFFRHVNRLSFTAEPDYKELTALLESIVKERGYKMEAPFDWEAGGRDYEHTVRVPGAIDDEKVIGKDVHTDGDDNEDKERNDKERTDKNRTDKDRTDKDRTDKDRTDKLDSHRNKSSKSDDKKKKSN